MVSDATFSKSRIDEEFGDKYYNYLEPEGLYRAFRVDSFQTIGF